MADSQLIQAFQGNGINTDAVGTTNFDKAGAAAIIADVNGTAASVAAALENLNSGSLPGQVPGVGLINALASAQGAAADFATANKAAVDALAAKLKVTYTPAQDTFDEQLDAVQTAANLARTNASGEKNTQVLELRVADAQKAVEAARTDLNASNKTLAATFEAAYAKNEALKGAAANDITVVKAGLTADGGTAAVVSALTTDYPPITNVDTLYSYYTDADTLQAARTAIDKAFTDASISVYANFKAVAVVDVAKNAAQDASDNAEAAVEAPTAANNAVFTDAVKAAALATTTYTNTKEADVNKAAVDAIDTGRDAAKAISDANTALAEYNSTHTDTKTVALATVAASDTVKEAFYFAAKPTDANDFTIGTAAVASSHFGAGDAIVLGSAYTFNSDALSTGDNNKLEVFFVKTDAGTQVVVETANYGSAAATPSATTGVAAGAGDNLAVITLTGVTAEHLSFNNGVISYV